MDFMKTIISAIKHWANNRFTVDSTLSTVAKTGQYEDLQGIINEESIPESIVRTSQISDFVKSDSLANVATTGSYDDLVDKPTFSTVATTGNYNDLSNKPTLAAVATTGSYNDLTDKPVIINTFIELLDRTKNIIYRVAMRDGNLIIYLPISSISVKTPPDKTEYMVGETFDTTGIVLTATMIDGVSQKEVYECIAPNPYLSYGQTSIELQYTDEDGEVHTTSTPVTVIPFDPTEKLVDFTYVANDDGTYTLTGWNQTLNGITSTEMVIPDNSVIVL